MAQAQVVVGTFEAIEALFNFKEFRIINLIQYNYRWDKINLMAREKLATKIRMVAIRRVKIYHNKLILKTTG